MAGINIFLHVYDLTSIIDYLRALQESSIYIYT